jgi:hypothetical protein
MSSHVFHVARVPGGVILKSGTRPADPPIGYSGPGKAPSIRFRFLVGGAFFMAYSGNIKTAPRLRFRHSGNIKTAHSGNMPTLTF